MVDILVSVLPGGGGKKKQDAICSVVIPRGKLTPDYFFSLVFGFSAQ